MISRVKMELVAALVEALPDGALLLDPAGRVAAINEQAGRYCGLSPERARNHTLAGLRPEARWLPPVLDLALSGNERRSYIYEVDGRRLVAVATPLAAASNGPAYLLCTLRDTTELDRLQRQVERMRAAQERYQDELQGLRANWSERAQVIAASKAMQQVMDLAARVARVDSTVLLLGESGVGKGIVAQAIHRLSGRQHRPLVKVDCAAIPETLLESELFGYESGAFTGARREGKAGIIEQAAGGTLFLDEIAEVPPAVQVKLLRLIQDRHFTRVGGVKQLSVDVRIVAATHRDLQHMVEQQLFRADLYYRLHVVPVTIPPLRERPEDIPPLVRSFLDQYKAKYRVDMQFHPDVIDVFLAYRWPGNVRELENMVERLVVTTEGPLVQAADLPPALARAGAGPAGTGWQLRVQGVVPLKQAVRQLEAELVREAVRLYGTTTRVGEALGIHQSTAVRKMQRYLRTVPGAER